MIVLASQSASRKAMLAAAGVAFEAMPAHLDERAPVTVDQYERLVRETDVMMTARDYEPRRDFLEDHFERAYQGRTRLVLRRIENHHRCYEWTTG